MKAFVRWTLNRSRRLTCLALAILAAPPGRADASSWKEGLELHAFVSQGYVHTSDNRFMGDSQNGSFDFREIGASASLRLSPRWLFSAQLLSRKAGDLSNDSVDVDYALVDFTAHSSETWRLGLVAGRFKNPIGLYNDTRDVPFTRPSVFLPQSIYWEKLRDIMLSADGVQGYAEYYSGRHAFFLQLGVGLFQTDSNLEWTYLNMDPPGEFERGSPEPVGRLLYELDGGRVRLGLSGLTAGLTYRPGPVDFLGSGDLDLEYWVGSFQYNAEKWSFTVEYMQEPVRMEDYGLPVLERDQAAESYYLQGLWSPTSDWELMLRYDAAFLDRKDRSGEEQSAHDGLPRHRYYAKTWSVGITWKPDRRIMLRAQHDWVDGTAFLSGRENLDPTTMSDRWRMLSLSVSLGF